jgi:hypothetical protein
MMNSFFTLNMPEKTGMPVRMNMQENVTTPLESMRIVSMSPRTDSVTITIAPLHGSLETLP